MFNPLLNMLFDVYAWRGTLLVCSGIVLHGAVAGALMWPASENEEKLRDAEQFTVDDSVKEKVIKSDQMNLPSAHIRNKQHETFVVDDICNDPLPVLFVDCPVRINKKDDSLDNSKEIQANKENEEGHTDVGKEEPTDASLDDIRHEEVSHKDKFKVQTEDGKLINTQSDGYITDIRNENDGGIYENPSVNQFMRTRSTKPMANNSDRVSNEKEKGLFAWYILKDPKFIFFMASQFFLAIAYMIPFTYLPEVVMSLGYRLVYSQIQVILFHELGEKMLLFFSLYFFFSYRISLFLSG